MLELKPEGPLSWSFDITRDGADVGKLELRRLKASATLRINGQTFTVERDGLFGPYLLSTGQRVVARAERAALIAPRYRIVAEDRQLLLNSKGFLMRMAQLSHGDVRVATIERTSLFRRGVHVDVSEGAPLPLVLFSASIMIFFWRRQKRSSS